MISGINSNTPIYAPQMVKRDEKEELKTKEISEFTNSKVEEIKRQVQNGEYKIDIQKTAEKMVLNLLG